jgi:hypothetical protein
LSQDVRAGAAKPQQIALFGAGNAVSSLRRSRTLNFEL